MLDKHIKWISNENKYKMYLEIASLYNKFGNLRYKEYLKEAYKNAEVYCSPEVGQERAKRQIYITLLRWKNIQPPKG